MYLLRCDLRLRQGPGSNRAGGEGLARQSNVFGGFFGQYGGRSEGRSSEGRAGACRVSRAVWCVGVIFMEGEE